MNRRDALKQTVLVMGYTVSVPTILGIFASCNSSPALTWKPEFFSEDQASLISELAETILPRTKTPGAKDLKIDQFIDQLLKQVLSPEDQNHFLRGMDAFEAQAKEVNGKSFINSSAEQRVALLTKIEKDTEKTPPSVWGINMKKDATPLPFYRQVKDLTLLGYFSSEHVGKKLLRYDPIPGAYSEDVPLSQVGNISFE